MSRDRGYRNRLKHVAQNWSLGYKVIKVKTWSAICIELQQSVQYKCALKLVCIGHDTASAWSVYPLNIPDILLPGCPSLPPWTRGLVLRPQPQEPPGLHRQVRALHPRWGQGWLSLTWLLMSGIPDKKHVKCKHNWYQTKFERLLTSDSDPLTGQSKDPGKIDELFSFIQFFAHFSCFNVPSIHLTQILSW